MVGVLAGGLLAVQLLAPWTAMADRFDIVTFDAQPGWSRRAITDGLVFESHPADCQIVMSKSHRSVGTLTEDLDHAWSSLLEGHAPIGEVDTPAQQDLGDGVRIAQRLALVGAGDRKYMTMLNLLRKGDRLVMVVVNLAGPKALERCGTTIGDFIAGLKLDTGPDLPPPPAPKPNVGATEPMVPQSPKSDPQLAARFGNSVVGTWRYVFTTVQWGAAPVRHRLVIEIRFAADATYTITRSGPFGAETGTYRVDGQRILMRPKVLGDASGPYTLDWFFGDHPEHRGNWGLILRSSADWTGGDKDDWRTFKPAE
jgi:hypothetical protein